MRLASVRLLSLVPTLAVFLVLLSCASGRAEESLFRDGVEGHAWYTPYDKFVGRSDMDCIPKERFCRTKADENTVLGLPSGPIFLFFSPKKELVKVELHFDEEAYAAFAKKLEPVVKNAADIEKKHSGTTVDGIVISTAFAENAGLEVVTISPKKQK